MLRNEGLENGLETRKSVKKGLGRVKIACNPGLS